MRKQMVAVAMVVAAAVSAPAYGQDAKAAEILAKTRQAIGGKKIESVKTLSVNAQLQRNLGSMQMSSDVEMLLEMPDKYVRTDTSSGMMNMSNTTGFNGDKGILPANASMMPGGGGAMVIRMGPGGPINDGPRPTPEQMAEMSKQQVRTQRTDVSRYMLGWFGMAHPTLGAQYTYAGEAESPDGKAHVIDVKNADGFAARLFIDQNNFLPLMVTYQGPQARVMTSSSPATPGQRATTTSGGATTTFSHGAGGGQGQPQVQTRELTDEERKTMAADREKQIQDAVRNQPMVDYSLFFDGWKEVDGVLFPHTMRRASGGTTSEEWTISKVKINPKIDAKKFAVPEPK